MSMFVLASFKIPFQEAVSGFRQYSTIFVEVPMLVLYINILQVLRAGLSAPLRGDFSPYSDRPVNLALIQTQPPYTCQA